jgi:ABC-type microcin C transport system duplicated ATPase subunit YejF
VSDKILVLKKGKVIEYNDAEIVFNSPKDEYTKKLISSVV